MNIDLCEIGTEEIGPYQKPRGTSSTPLIEGALLGGTLESIASWVKRAKLVNESPCRSVTKELLKTTMSEVPVDCRVPLQVGTGSVGRCLPSGVDKDSAYRVQQSSLQWGLGREVGGLIS